MTPQERHDQYLAIVRNINMLLNSVGTEYAEKRLKAAMDKIHVAFGPEMCSGTAAPKDTTNDKK